MTHVTDFTTGNVGLSWGDKSRTTYIAKYFIGQARGRERTFLPFSSLLLSKEFYLSLAISLLAI